MFNVGGGEFLVILLIALIVLGPQKLPEAARQIGSLARELRKMSTSFQDELKHALDEPIEESARERGRQVVSSEEAAAPEPDTDSVDRSRATDVEPPRADPSDERTAASDGTGAADTEVDGPAISTAAAAGMYDLSTDADPDVDDAEPETGDEPAPASAAEAAGLYDTSFDETDPV